jgi:hypothetical protein
VALARLAAPPPARTPAAASAATPSTAAPARRPRRAGRGPEAGEVWLAGVSVAAFGLAVMTLPFFVCSLCCHDHSPRYPAGSSEENSLSIRGLFPCPLDLVIPARFFRPGFLFPPGPSGPGPRSCAANRGPIGRVTVAWQGAAAE